MRQEELFTVDKPAANTPGQPIPGFDLQVDYVTMEDELQLLRRVDAGQWQNDYLRRIQQYGLGYGAAGTQSPSWLRDFPEWLVELAARVSDDAGFERFPENCVINEYLPPQGIGPHRDYSAFGDKIACVSLGSDVVMDFANSKRAVKVAVFVPARSLWVIEKEARSEWVHGIARRFTDIIAGERRRRGRRVSITFRTAADPVLAEGVVNGRRL
jgi:alkylated DNA repair dioxygenase AlkB